MKKYKNIIIILVLFAIGIFVIYKYNLTSQLTLENIPVLKEKFLSLGWLAFFAYFTLYIIVCLFSLPGTPVTILGGALFGPLLGTVYTVVSASAGLALSFLVARYGFKNIMLEKFSSSKSFIKIYDGVEKQGWRILMITRLLPIFPFALQNYIYGLTNINFFTYWGLSTLFIIPGTAAYTLSSGAVLSGEFSTKNLIYLGIGALCFVLVSFLPKMLNKSGKNIE